MDGFTAASVVCGFVAGLLLFFRRRREDRETKNLSFASHLFNAESSPRIFHCAISEPEWSTLPPRLFAALWYADEIPPEKMPNLASTLLERGIDGPRLRQCAGELRPTKADLHPYIDQLFQELGVAAPMEQANACEVVGFHLVERIATGELDPFDGAERVAHLFGWVSSASTRFAPLIHMADDIEFEINQDREADQREEILAYCKIVMESTELKN